MARYRGSALGLLWAVLTPLVMIAVFTFLFAGVFGARFTGRRHAVGLRALPLLRAAAVDGLLRSRCSSLSGIVVAHANLVKRVVFPLETLPVAQALAALAAQLFGTAALLVAALLIRGELHADGAVAARAARAAACC